MCIFSLYPEFTDLHYISHLHKFAFEFTEYVNLC